MYIYIYICCFSRFLTLLRLYIPFYPIIIIMMIMMMMIIIIVIIIYIYIIYTYIHAYIHINIYGIYIYMVYIYIYTYIYIYIYCICTYRHIYVYIVPANLQALSNCSLCVPLSVAPLAVARRLFSVGTAIGLICEKAAMQAT